MFHYEREPLSPLRRRYIDDLWMRNKSPRSIGTYVLRVAQFAKRFGKSRGVARLRGNLCSQARTIG